MGRPTRIQFPGACYHVILQGNNRQDIFVSPQDRRFFLAMLRSYKERYDLKIYAYCLMANYVHLLMETAHPNLSRVMQGFNTAYTKYFNQKHNAVGHVFQGRYKALLVDKKNYLLELTRYIHLAPVRAGLKEKPWRYAWSSCPAYVEAEGRESLVDSAPVLRTFSGGRLKQSVRYLQSVKERVKHSAADLPPARSGFVGGEDFIAEVRRAYGASAEVQPSGQQRASAKAILQEVMAKHNLDEERLFGRSQWREISSVRKEAIYRIWKEARMGVTEISRMFNRTPSAVSQLIRSVETSRVSSN